MLRVARRWWVGWSLGLLAGAVPAAPPVLTLHYQERPPYSTLEADGHVSGLVATPAARALERAGIAYRWERTPAQRQLALIQQGDGLHCGVGWFRNAEREAAGRFNAQPLYRDRPFAALVRADAVWPADGRAADALAQRAARLLVKDGFSYGAVLDALIARSPATIVRTPAELDAMARMLAARRADWMIVSPEEAPALLARVPDGRQTLRVVRLSDVPAGEARHLYCNRAVPAAWLARVDAALAP
jgi:polar amino acid transport system substrate-binding protein